MIDPDIQRRIKAVMGDVFEIDPVLLGPDSSPASIEAWDSLRHINLVIALEQELGIQFTVEEIEQAMSFEAICRLVAGKLAG